MDYPKLANCSLKHIKQACRKLDGCIITNAGKHVAKVTHIKSQKAFVIPNANPLKRGLVWDFVRTFLQGQCGYSEKEIFSALWC